MRTDTPVQTKLSDYETFPFAIEKVDLSFDLEPSATRVKSRMEIVRKAKGDLVLDGVSLALKNIWLDGVALEKEAYSITNEQLIIPAVPDHFTLETDVLIDPSKNTVLSGLYISADRFCSQCESTGFRRITYWPDRPDVMSRFTVRVEADKARYPILLSNGTPGPAGDLEAGRHYAIWDDPHPKPSYLFALCAGDYDVLHDDFTTMHGDPVKLAVHVDKGDADRAAWAMESLKASMRWDETVFGRAYDLGTFNIVAVRDFNFGAMENKGLNVFNSAYVLADEATATDADFEAIESIVGHEYFHNWTGNRITCRDWFQLCLKEGLTVYRDQEFSADMRSRPVQRIKDVIRLRASQFAEDAGPLAHAVRPDHYASIENLYTATVYEKGAELIRMLKAYIGDKNFAHGMQIYFDLYDGQATTIEHFYKCFETASDRDLSAFRRWYAQPGTPTVSVDEAWDPETRTLRATFTQTNPVTPGNNQPEPLPIPVSVAAFSPDGQKIEEHVLVLDQASMEWIISGQSDRPFLSINRNFSAPVRLAHKVSPETSLKTAQLDDDPFNQWEILQRLLTDELLKIAYDDKHSLDAALLTALVDAVKQRQDDPAFAALLMRLPDISELFLERTPTHPAKLGAAKKRVLSQLADMLEDRIAETLSTPSPQPFKPDAEQAGVRALRTALITICGARASATDQKLLKDQFDHAPNMTESLASLRALCMAGGDAKPAALATFYERWKDNELVIDKWFGVQAATGTTDEVAALLQHPAFDLGNPNRVRSVIGVYANQNLSKFHASDGGGYRLVADIILKADKLNPALAARLLQAFEQWRNLEPDARAEAEATLKDLQSHDLSSNTNDILSRTLG